MKPIIDAQTEINNTSVPIENIIQKILIQQIECSKNIEQNNRLIGDKLANMITVVNLGSKMTELMLQNKYYLDSRGKKIYDEIRENAKNAVITGMGKITDTTNVKLYEGLDMAQNEIAELRETLGKIRQEKEELQKENQILREKIDNANRQATITIEGLREYIKLTEWYETMIVEMKKDEDTNVKWYQTYNWREGMEQYAINNPKPKVEKFTF